MGASDLADLVAWLPQGAALWRSMGGPAAWSQETAMGAQVEHAVRALHWAQTEDAKHRRNYPDHLEPPEFYQSIKAQQRTLERRIDKYKRRHLKEPDAE